jgi:hypothetical protein
LLAVTTTDAEFRQALSIADNAIAGRIADPTGGARHFVSVSLFNAKCGSARPANTFYCGSAPSDRQIIADQIYIRNVA